MVNFSRLLNFCSFYSTMSSSHLPHNLSHPINFSKTTVHSNVIVRAVNKTLLKYYYEVHYQDYMNFYNLHKHLLGRRKYSPVMQSEKIILCEINACLWIKALNSTVNNITERTYPHYIIVQEFINYLLNANSTEHFRLVEECFWKLLFSHPPGPEMFDYYWQILSDHFVILNDEKTEDQTLFFCLIEAMTNSLKTEMNHDKNSDSNKLRKKRESVRSNEIHSTGFNSDPNSSEPVENFNFALNKDEANTSKKQVYFVHLPWSEKINRCLIAFNFVYNVLETDFIFWLHSEKLKPSFNNTRPLLSHLLWRNVMDIGFINKEVYKILYLYKLVMQSTNTAFRNSHVIKKLVILLGEIIRCSDSTEQIKYPFVGRKSDNFFRELTIILHHLFDKSLNAAENLHINNYNNHLKCDGIQEFKKNPKENELIVNFKPPWLRLFLCCHLLSSITGYQCVPDLTGVCDILEHIAYNESKSQCAAETSEKPSKATNSRLMQKLRKIKSINAKLRNGKSHLHLACEENDVEKIKALLTFPELDVNLVDQDGWTALHTAASKGNATSVEELLSFCPRSGDARKPVNTRARGPESFTPLMCAAGQGHARICRLLLEHSGSVLLEDINELNQTPLELCNKPEVMEILHHYKRNPVLTLHSHKNINFDLDLKEIILRLCVEMIQAYFCTYRTWDVYRTIKRSENNSDENFVLSDAEIKWDYMRYHRDIKRNIEKLIRLIPELENVKEFKRLKEIYIRILSFNKTF